MKGDGIGWRGFVSILAILGTFFVIAMVAKAQGATIYVPDDCPTIQQAIENASDGDTIIVHDGTYTEQLIINKQLTLMAGSSPVLDFSGYSGYGIKITWEPVKAIIS